MGTFLNCTKPGNQDPCSEDPVPNNNSTKPAPKNLESAASLLEVKQNPPIDSDLDTKAQITFWKTQVFTTLACSAVGVKLMSTSGGMCDLGV